MAWQAATPAVDAVAVLRAGPFEIAVVEWVDDVGVDRVPAATGAVDDDVVLIDEPVSEPPEAVNLIRLVRGGRGGALCHRSARCL